MDSYDGYVTVAQADDIPPGARRTVRSTASSSRSPMSMERFAPWTTRARTQGSRWAKGAWMVNSSNAPGTAGDSMFEPASGRRIRRSASPVSRCVYWGPTCRVKVPLTLWEGTEAHRREEFLRVRYPDLRASNHRRAGEAAFTLRARSRAR